MVELWKEVLQREKIGIHDNFFHIGGNSLHAISLIGKIRHHFQVEVPIHALFRMQTVAELCKQMDSEQYTSEDCLVLLQKGEANSSPLFLVHGLGGGVLSFASLVQEVGPEQTVYGLQAPGYDTDETALCRIEEIAQRYIRNIKRVCPDGPYRLMGWSFGGAVAFAIAQSLEQSGAPVEFLGIIDTPIQRGRMVLGEGEAEMRETLQEVLAQLQTDREVEAIVQELSEVTQLVEEWREQFARNDAQPDDSLRRQLSVFIANKLVTLGIHFIKPVACDIHLFLATQQIDPLEWKQLTSGQCKCVTVGGDHYSMLTAPHVAEIVTFAKRVLVL